jgi:hypothetical protein
MPKYLKPRPNVPFDGITCTRYDNGYYKNKVTFTILGNCDLWIQFCNDRAPKKTAHDFYVDNFMKYPAIKIIVDINDFNATKGTKTEGE